MASNRSKKRKSKEREKEEKKERSGPGKDYKNGIQDLSYVSFEYKFPHRFYSLSLILFTSIHEIVNTCPILYYQLLSTSVQSFTCLQDWLLFKPYHGCFNHNQRVYLRSVSLPLGNHWSKLYVLNAKKGQLTANDITTLMEKRRRRRVFEFKYTLKHSPDKCKREVFQKNLLRTWPLIDFWVSKWHWTLE